MLEGTVESVVEGLVEPGRQATSSNWTSEGLDQARSCVLDEGLHTADIKWSGKGSLQGATTESAPTRKCNPATQLEAKYHPTRDLVKVVMALLVSPQAWATCSPSCGRWHMALEKQHMASQLPSTRLKNCVGCAGENRGVVKAGGGLRASGKERVAQGGGRASGAEYLARGRRCTMHTRP